MLVDVFGDHPFYLAITPELFDYPVQRRIVLEKYFSYVVQEAARTGRYEAISDETCGAALWMIPGSLEMKVLEETAKSVYLRSLLGKTGSENHHRISTFMERQRESFGLTDAWRLAIFGVSPLSKRKGIRAELLRPTLEEADRLGVTCALETYLPENLVLFSLLGFEVLSSVVEPLTKCEYFILKRDPVYNPRGLQELVK